MRSTLIELVRDAGRVGQRHAVDPLPVDRKSYVLQPRESPVVKKIDEIEQPTSCLNHSQPDEPIFVLCARDPVASRIVRGWAERYRESKGGLREMTPRQVAKYNEAHGLADEMDAWALDHGLIDECGRPKPKS